MKITYKDQNPTVLLKTLKEGDCFCFPSHPKDIYVVANQDQNRSLYPEHMLVYNLVTGYLEEYNEGNLVFPKDVEIIVG